MVAAAIIGILAAIAVPNFGGMQYRAKRVEAPSNVDGIKMAQMGCNARYDRCVEVSSRNPSAAITKVQRDWDASPPCNTLGGRSDGMVRGRYKAVSKSSSDFLVNGESDVDHDDSHAQFTATRTMSSAMNAGASVC